MDDEDRVSLIMLNETVLPEEAQDQRVNQDSSEVSESEELITNNTIRLPNIKIFFSDKLAIARGERVEIYCDTGKIFNFNLKKKFLSNLNKLNFRPRLKY